MEKPISKWQCGYLYKLWQRSGKYRSASCRMEIKAGLEGKIANNWYLHGQIGGEVGANSFKIYQKVDHT